jgi:hypothetical protein
MGSLLELGHRCPPGYGSGQSVSVGRVYPFLLQMSAAGLTDSDLSLADLTDGDLILGSLDPTLFPGLSSLIQVHQGFANEQAK